MLKITLADIADATFVDRELDKHPTGMAVMELDDGSIEVPVRRALLSAWLMRPALGRVPITSDFIYSMEKFSMKGINILMNKIDQRFFELEPDSDLSPLLKDLAMSIDGLNNFALEHTQGYQESFDLIDLCKLMKQKPLKDLVDNLKLDNDEGTKIAEVKIANAGKMLEKILKSNTDIIEFNPLYPHIDDINMNQLNQILLSYGPRSDIDDSMLQHVVKGSALSGLRDFDDFFVEAHSAKKSNWLAKDAIKNAQYSSRKVQLACFELRHIVKGDCGTTLKNIQIVRKEIKHNFVGKFIDIGDNNRRFLLTNENINQFIDKPIKMYSAFGCKVKNGVCEHCFGKTGRYILKTMHIGELCSSILLSAITQKILSAKHLIKTDSQTYKLPTPLRTLFRIAESAVYEYTAAELKEQLLFLSNSQLNDVELDCEFDEEHITAYRADIIENVLNDTEILWREEYQRALNNGLKIVIPLNVFRGSVSDISLKPPAKSFTTIMQIYVQDDKMPSPKPIVFGDDQSAVYFSEYTLEFINNRMLHEKVAMDDNYMYVPMMGFNVNKPFVISPTVNTDVVKFVSVVNSFLQSKLPKYTSTSNALTDFTSIIYRESIVPISHVECVLKAFTMVSETDPAIPVIEDLDNVMFANTNNAISRTPSGRMAYQDLGRYYADPETYLQPDVPGLFDPFFGSCESIKDQ